MSATDGDRERAKEIAGAWFSWNVPNEVDGLREAIAQALADERERAENRAYSEGAADALYGATAELMPHETLTVAGLRAASDRIRREIDSQS